MNMLSRRDPFRELNTLRSRMDQLFDTAFFNPSLGLEPASWDLAMDVVENEDEFVVKASLPGINPDDLDITFTANTLTIRGETKTEDEKKEARYHLRERRYGSFARSIALPANIKAGDIQASYTDGVLTLHLPKAEEARPKRIQINAGDSSQVLEGKLSDGNGKK
jgi:HSP20 family protein